MIIGGYKKISFLSKCKNRFVRLDDLSIACTYEELVRIAAFFNKAVNLLDGYTFPYGECTIQFRDEDNGWRLGEHDIALVVTGSDPVSK